MMFTKSEDIIVYLYDNKNIDSFNDSLNFWDKKYMII